MALCAVCRGTGKCRACGGHITATCSHCWPKGRCPRCHGTGTDPV